MSESQSLSRTLATRLLSHGASVLPAGSSIWAQAMRNELAYVDRDSAALRWAIGCLSACYMARMKNMEVQAMKAVSISRVALSLEVLFCFLPVTGGVFVAMFFAKNLPLASAPMSVLLMTTSLVGPLGLFLGFKSVVLERRQMSTRVALIFFALAAWTAFGNSFFVLTVANPISELRALTIMALLPVIGAAHLFSISSGRQSNPAPE